MPPTARRPLMPDYGVVGPEEGSGLLEWSWAVERLTASHDYWLATVRPDGRPHVTPVWGVWQDEALWFSAGGEARKTRNLRANPHAAMTTDDPLDPVVVEGVVARVEDGPTIASFTGWVNDKYETDYGVDFFTSNVCLRLDPTWAFGLLAADFTGSPTAWTFPPD